MCVVNYDVIFHDDDDEHDEQSSLSGVAFALCDFGPQMRTVASSLADANRDGYTGFQETQFTVFVWPANFPNGSSRRICQIQTNLSSLPLATKLSFTPPKQECMANLL